MSYTYYLGHAPTPQQIAFHAQTPQPSFPAPALHIPSLTTLRIRARPIDAGPTLASQLYETFTQTNRICTKRHGNWAYRVGESHDLLNSYAYALHLQDREEKRGSKFRDALMDALAEYFDEYGLEGFPWGLFEGIAERGCAWRLRHLVEFYAALTTFPGSYGADLRCRAVGFEDAFRDEVAVVWARQTGGRTGARIWYKLMRNGRCRFHEHGVVGVCWR